MSAPRTTTTKGQPRPVTHYCACKGCPGLPWEATAAKPHPCDKGEPAPVEPTDDTRARQCLDGLWYALLTRHGTDYLDLLLLDAKSLAQPMEVGSKRYELARDYAERLHRGS